LNEFCERDSDRAYTLYLVLQSVDFTCSFIFYWLSVQAWRLKSAYYYLLLSRFIYVCFFI
jgi:hypothetical protein